jgi:hypothetical protein
MKLPYREKSEITEKKIGGYLLSPTHPVGRGKASFFGRFGFTAEARQQLQMRSGITPMNTRLPELRRLLLVYAM